MKRLTVGESFDGYLRSLKLRDDVTRMNDKELYYYIFDEFLGNITAYISSYTLDRLENEGIIDKNIYDISSNIRNELLEMVNGPYWNINAIKTSGQWEQIFEKLKKLDVLIHRRWTDEEIEYLKSL
ncbi:hypothetical protein [Lysinibacillus odysseyi]|uniref:Uncharacterized protein n=1 Tax=Lysinibacillus odysseyi 34hs-1 = NBRC 100172 TaxID=1220589 RepID=A0A0A3IPG1_9BACI|nr:hypothetical protein [Lysinibacillus odysseyi]KGR85325.1 hypothetical protein CD32_08770 [Lysinibacillus odysseyi 34hs-1 = NBRC 100172]